MENTEYNLQALRYYEIQKKLKALEEEKTEVRNMLEAVLKTIGTKTDKGHIIYTSREAGMNIEVKQELRTQAIIEPDAVDILKRNKKKEFIDTIEVVNTDKLQKAIEEGKIKSTLIEDIYKMKETYALKVSVKPMVK